MLLDGLGQKFHIPTFHYLIATLISYTHQELEGYRQMAPWIGDCDSFVTAISDLYVVLASTRGNVFDHC